MSQWRYLDLHLCKWRRKELFCEEFPAWKFEIEYYSVDNKFFKLTWIIVTDGVWSESHCLRLNHFIRGIYSRHFYLTGWRKFLASRFKIAVTSSSSPHRRNCLHAKLANPIISISETCYRHPQKKWNENYGKTLQFWEIYAITGGPYKLIGGPITYEKFLWDFL